MIGLHDRCGATRLIGDARERGPGAARRSETPAPGVGGPVPPARGRLEPRGLASPCASPVPPARGMARCSRRAAKTAMSPCVSVRGWPSAVRVAATRCALGTCGVARCSRGPRGRTWGAWSYFVLRGRTWTCAVVPSRARSYLREALRYDRVQLGTTARLRVRPGVPRYDRARGRPTNDAGRTTPQVRPRAGPAEDEVSRALRPVRDARPPA